MAGRDGLVKEWQWKISQVEQPCVDTRPLLQVSEDPPRGFLREASRSRTTDDHRNEVHRLLLAPGVRHVFANPIGSSRTGLRPLRPEGEAPAGANKVAGISVRDAFQIVLMLRFCHPELARWF